MITWMFYTIGISALLGIASVAGERVRRSFGASGRWLWLGAIVGSTVLPMVVPFVSGFGMSGGADAAGVSVGEVQVMAGAVPAAGGLAIVERALLAGWLATSVLLAAGLALSALSLARRRRGWHRRTIDGTSVLVSDVTGPAVVGFLRPEVVVPAWALGWSDASLRMMVSHEREHMRGRDQLLLLTVITAIVAMPWNLSLFWQARRLRLAVEMDCDARVLDRSENARDYGLLLIRVGRMASAGWTPAAAAFSHPRSFLERRVAALGGRRRLHRGVVAGLCAVAAATLIGAAMIPAPRAPVVPDLFASGPAGDANRPDLLVEDTVPEPTFTPYDVRPKLRNAAEAADILNRLYPRSLREAGITGTTVLWVFIDAGGVVQTTRVVQSSGVPELDDAAEAAMRELAFTPAMNRGERVAVWIQLPVTFTVRADTVPGPEAHERQREPPEPSGVSARGDGPSFTPYEVKPVLQNPEDIGAFLDSSYPPALREAGLGGTTVLWVMIDADGSVIETRVARGSGHAEFDEAARMAMFRARFTPAMNRGEPVPVWIQLPVTFQPRDQRDG